MEILILIAGFLAGFVVIGHFLFGIKWYLKPMLNSNLELVPKATMQSVFHYISIYLTISSIILLSIGFGLLEKNFLLIKFIGINFICFSLIQIFYSFKNKVKNPLITMFQWTLFLPIGILCLV